MDHSLPGSSVHGILQVRILERVVIFFSRGSSQPRDAAHCLLCLLHWRAGSLMLAPPEKSTPTGYHKLKTANHEQLTRLQAVANQTISLLPTFCVSPGSLLQRAPHWVDMALLELTFAQILSIFLICLHLFFNRSWLPKPTSHLEIKTYLSSFLEVRLTIALGQVRISNKIS